MRSAIGWAVPAAAVVATGIAIWAGPNVSIAVPAAALAILAAAMLFVGGWLDRAERGRRRPLPRSEPEMFRLRSSLRSGPLGREDIVTTLDRVERGGPTPDLPARSPQEIERLVQLPLSEFREYLRTRLDDLEARM